VSESAVALIRGYFQPRTKGKGWTDYVQVERGRIQFFAQVWARQTLSISTRSARARVPDIVAPPSFFTAIDASANEERRRLGHRRRLHS